MASEQTIVRAVKKALAETGGKKSAKKKASKKGATKSASNKSKKVPKGKHLGDVWKSGNSYWQARKVFGKRLAVKVTKTTYENAKAKKSPKKGSKKK